MLTSEGLGLGLGPQSSPLPQNAPDLLGKALKVGNQVEVPLVLFGLKLEVVGHALKLAVTHVAGADCDPDSSLRSAIYPQFRDATVESGQSGIVDDVLLHE